MGATIIFVLGILLILVDQGDQAYIQDAAQRRPDLAAHVDQVQTTMNPCALVTNHDQGGHCTWYTASCDSPGVFCPVGEAAPAAGHVLLIAQDYRDWPHEEMVRRTLHEFAHAYLWDACSWCTTNEQLTEACAQDRANCPPLPSPEGVTDADNWQAE